MIDLILASEKFKKLASTLDMKMGSIMASGVNFSGFLFNLLAILRTRSKLILIVEDYRISKRVYEVLSAFDIPVFEFFEDEINFFKSYSHSKDIENSRLKSIYSFYEAKSAVMITSAKSVLSPLMPFDKYEHRILDLRVGKDLDMEDFCAKLVAYGYERVDVISSSAQFARRGSIVDVFDPTAEAPVRIEFFGDEIDSMRRFEIETQLSIENIQSTELRPCKLSLLFEDIDKSISNLKKKASSSVELAAQYNALIEELENSGYLDDGMKFIPVLSGQTSNILEYCRDVPVVVWNYSNVINTMNEACDAWKIRFNDELLNGNALNEQVVLVSDGNKLIEQLSNRQCILFHSLELSQVELPILLNLEFNFSELGLYHKNITKISSDLVNWLKAGYSVVIALSSPNRINGMKQFLNDVDLIGRYVDARDFNSIRSGLINLVHKGVNAGFVSSELKLVLVSEYELYDEKQLNKGKKHQTKKRTNAFFDIEVGDFVVHEAYGIGQYLGVHQLEVDGDKKDYIKISYRNDDMLYVEVEKMDLLKKYIGDDVKNVKLSRLGTLEWKNTKSRVRKEIEDIAQDLVELYAKRSKQEGFAFSEDTPWQRDFEDAFEHSETLDQLKAIEEIKADMQSKRPMDRLLCGDVGYGKTEVAIRAIFKAVQDSKQVAFLVPTTILAQQHYNTMLERFKNFPIRIEMMSRFKSAKDQKLILQDIESGVVDVVVGTHRILSNDLQFKDFGLLVIDEEQRFGVKDKEKIKKWKNNIDVLTLSATPIPRTLHMSLMGIRDMSLIEEPPEDRYPVQTYVVDYNSNVIKDAINRELARGGQVYFVHNRVKDIDGVQASLKHLIPDLKVEVVHGQMSAKELESVMLGFLNRDFDVLVSTVIVETGLDIPNVNTIIINNSDYFGLSQLYQLKGRVGRSNRVGYAYLLYNPNKSISEISQKRLRAIKEFSELGAGFKIAMRDLEIRGAGSLLGMRQHGHMVSVGYELYSKMIEDVMSIVTGNEKHDLADADEVADLNIDIKCSAYIPENYIADYRYKLEFYKKISSIREEQDKLRIESELIDMFGDIPDVVSNLINIGYIRALALRLGIKDISDSKFGVKLVFSKNYRLEMESFAFVLQKYGKQLSLGSGEIPVLTLKNSRRITSKAVILSDVVELLNNMVNAQKMVS